jgi:chromosome segregation ATPase
LDAVRAEFQTQTEEVLRRRDAEVEASLRELEAQLHKEMQQKEEAVQAVAKQREQELIAQLSADAEAREFAAKVAWETEFQTKTRAVIEPFKLQLARIEKERDEAAQSASEHARQVQHLEKKLTEASVFLNGWRNGKHVVGAS